MGRVDDGRQSFGEVKGRDRGDAKGNTGEGQQTLPFLALPPGMGRVAQPADEGEIHQHCGSQERPACRADEELQQRQGARDGGENHLAFATLQALHHVLPRANGGRCG